MDELELMLVCSIIVGAFYLGVYLSHKRSIKRIKEKLSQPTIDLDEGLTGDTIPVISVVVNARPFQIPIEKKEDFIPKKKMKCHTLEEPIEHYSEDAVEDEGCGCANVCDNCYDTTDYEYPF
tara:strand:+ start:1466 stop:1831 length:366 start_codon:yes stop_codon:yes gene_type:complete